MLLVGRVKGAFSSMTSQEVWLKGKLVDVRKSRLMSRARRIG